MKNLKAGREEKLSHTREPLQGYQQISQQAKREWDDIFEALKEKIANQVCFT